MQQPSTRSRSGSNASPSGHIKLWQVDSFTDKPFSGNPAAVCMLAEPATENWMQSFAEEMNLSETSFVVPDPFPGRFHLRWFTPRVEVDLCGHATLAAARVIFDLGLVQGPVPIEFLSRSGSLFCRRSADDAISLDFPSTPIIDSASTDVAEAVSDALGIEPVSVHRSAYDLVAILDGPQQLRALTPNFQKLLLIDTRGLIVTSPSDDEGTDFLSRFFAPRCGIDEDPVTGSAHCCLAPYWSAVLGKSSVIGYQASRRGGTVRCEVQGDRTHLTGHAITVFEASWLR
ncbi:MAG: PhzF family phenazine biosynthesis protein [Planctomycetota bacterium]